MKKLLYSVLILLVIIGSFLVGSWYSQREKPKVNPLSLKSPAVIADVTVKPDTATDTGSSTGTVKISPEKRQAIGVRVGTAEKKPLTHTLRILGRVAVDETRIYRINAATDGWVRQTFPNSTGTLVKRDEVLAIIYAPEFLGAEQAYFYILNALDRFQAAGTEGAAQISQTKISIQQAADSLRNLGMGETQLKELTRTRVTTQNIEIRSPATGFVITRNVFPGDRFERGREFYRIADLGHVWILADIYENEAQYFRPGASAQISLPNQRKIFPAKVSDVLPQFDPTTRTLKIRLEADNPNYFMRPDMFVDIEIPIQMPPTITVPADAILDSGLKKTVFVDRGNGIFEPREVETGWRIGDRVEIAKGLEPGEKIVTSGTFLIDSESKLELAAQGMYTTLSKDPVCGVEVAMRKAEKAGLKATYKGKTFYFDSEECKDQFQKNPESYVKKE